MSVELFRDDDRGYTAWLTENARGYVLNIQRTLNPSDARVHHADCRTITGTPPRGRTWTGPYVKPCSLSLPELDAWALAHAGSAITRCGTCEWLPRAPSGNELQRSPPRTRAGATGRYAPCRLGAQDDQLAEARWRAQIAQFGVRFPPCAERFGWHDHCCLGAP
jgi:hypothetical protein